MAITTGFSEILFPKYIINLFFLLNLIQTAVLSILRFMGFSDHVEPHHHHHYSQHRHHPSPQNTPLSSILTREFLLVKRFKDTATTDGVPESCAVCLSEFEEEDELRCLINCKHMFHKDCLDRWMDHLQGTCPLCRTPLLPFSFQDEYRKRLRVATGGPYFYGQDLVFTDL